MIVSLFVTYAYKLPEEKTYRYANLVLTDDFVQRNTISCGEDIRTLEDIIRNSQGYMESLELVLLSWKRME